MNFIIRTEGAIIGFLHVAQLSTTYDGSVFPSDQRFVLMEVATALGAFIPVSLSCWCDL